MIEHRIDTASVHVKIDRKNNHSARSLSIRELALVPCRLLQCVTVLPEVSFARCTNGPSWLATIARNRLKLSGPGVFKIQEEPESPAEGVCLRYMIYDASEEV